MGKCPLSCTDANAPPPGESSTAIQQHISACALGWYGNLYGFAELYRRGQRQVWLHVDTENRTGATRLYERAGMRVEHRFDCWVERLA